MAKSKAFLDGWHVVDNTDEPHGQLRVESDEGCVCIVGTRTGEWTPDAERREMAALIAAAPEMLAVIREYQREARTCGWGGDGVNTRAANVLAKAEPPRKQRVTVTVEVEVEDRGNDEWVVDKAIHLVRDGNGVVTGTRIGGVMG
jgi:hypothetical protein